MVIPAEELQRRARTYRPLETTVIVCLNCGTEIVRSAIYERRDNGEHWEDPFAAPGVAMFTANHPMFCESLRAKARRLFGPNGKPRIARVTVRNVP